jgi:hypothetical protein
MLMQNIYQTGQPQEIHAPRVSGRPGATAFNMPRNSDAVLIDETAPVVWFAKTDSAGYKTMVPYKIEELKEESAENTYKTLEDRISRLEELVNGKQSNAKRKSADAASSAE